MEEPKIKYLYRYILEHWQGAAKLTLQEYEILRETPKGVWINIGWNREKWVSNYANKRFAQPSKREALKHYIRRKIYRNHCIELEMDRNNDTLITAKALLKKNDKQGKK